MKITNVTDLLQHKTVASLRQDNIITFAVNKQPNGNITLKGISSDSPYPSLRLHLGYDIELTVQEMTEHLNFDHGTVPGKGYFTTPDDIRRIIKDHEAKELQKLLTNHGQSKDALLHFLLDHAKNNARNPEDPDPVMFQFAELMTKKYSA